MCTYGAFPEIVSRYGKRTIEKKRFFKVTERIPIIEEAISKKAFSE